MRPLTTFDGHEGHCGDTIQLGIVTVSDRASQGEYEDLGGPAICSFFQEAIQSPWVAHYRCVPDEREAVEQALIELVDVVGCSVVVTTGGTGPAPRDITFVKPLTRSGKRCRIALTLPVARTWT